MAPGLLAPLPSDFSFASSVQSLMEMPHQCMSSTAPLWLGVTPMAASQQRWKQVHWTHMWQQQAVGLGADTLGSQGEHPEDGADLQRGCPWICWAPSTSQPPPEQGTGESAQVSTIWMLHPLGKPPKGWGQAPVLWHRDLWHKQLWASGGRSGGRGSCLCLAHSYQAPSPSPCSSGLSPVGLTVIALFSSC